MKKILIFRRLNKDKNINIKMGKEEKIGGLDDGYIVGFVDGEGTFNLVRYPDGRVRPQFLVFNTNREILEKIKQVLGLDCPIFEVNRVEDFIKSRKKCFRLQARSRKDIEKVLNFFNENKPIVKAKDFEIFKKAFEDWISKQK